MSESILFVDDDSMVLNALERTFFESEYETFFALSAPDAFEILKSNQIDMIVSDIRMLPVSGYDFLKQVRTEYPDILRLVLSAYGDREAMIKIICEGIAKVYILKPWENETLIRQIRHIFSMYHSLSSINDDVLFSDNRHLPVLPQMYSRMLSMIEEDRSLKEIAALIETDPSCTVNVLKLVNSSFYGMSISSVHQALVYMGINSVKDLILVSELFHNNKELPNEDLRIQLNRHMIISSTLLHGLHQHLLAKRIPDEFSVSGLLADIGRLITINYFPEKYTSVISEFRNNDKKSLSELEQDIIGYTHTQLGGLLLDWWNLPASSVEAALYHHDYSTAPHVLPANVMTLIQIADCYAWRIAECIEHITVPEMLISSLSISSEQLDEYVSSILNRADFADH